MSIEWEDISVVKYEKWSSFLPISQHYDQQKQSILKYFCLATGFTLSERKDRHYEWLNHHFFSNRI